MHGNESTATASLFDLINYTLSLEKPNKASSKNRKWFDSWRDKITLHIVPMLNPDGAKLEQRVNAQGIDINRDAMALQSPEGQLLFSLAEQIKPQFGFNLHSQNRYYAIGQKTTGKSTVGQSSKSAVISLLAPAYNIAKETNESRKNAKQIASLINQAIHQQYPDQIGRYDDTYSSRSFGDLFSAKGISTILIEAGYNKNDPHRQIPRWLTFLGLVESINAICDQSYLNESLEHYDAIPLNEDDGLVDLLLKNVSIDNHYQVDIGINYDEYFKNGVIDSIGDLSTITGLAMRDMALYKIEEMKGYELNESIILSTSKYIQLLQKGYGYFIGDESLLKTETSLPVVVYSDLSNPKINKSENINNRTKLNQSANFLFSKNGINDLAIIRGSVIKLFP